MNADDHVPPRVLAAESRRRFRELFSRSSLGCPAGQCDHSIGWHGYNGWDDEGYPINPRCTRDGCLCGTSDGQPT